MSSSRPSLRRALLVLALVYGGWRMEHCTAWKHPSTLATTVFISFPTTNTNKQNSKHNNNINNTQKYSHDHSYKKIAAWKKAARKDMGFLAGHAIAVFHDADTNRDGGISQSEVYELVLKFYVKVNQQAPIPPPSRESVMLLFRQADANRSGRLEVDEFVRLLGTIYASASSRVVVFKLVSMVCAPLLAMTVVRFLQQLPVAEVVHHVVWHEQIKMPAIVRRIVREESTWITILTVLFVSHLGKLALALVDWFWWGSTGTTTVSDAHYRGVNTLVEKP